MWHQTAIPHQPGGKSSEQSLQGPFQKTAVCNYRNTLDLSADIHRDTPVFASVLPRRPWGSLEIIFCNSVCSHLRGNAGLVLFFCSSWWPIKMECKNVHPNQSDLNQGPRPSFSPHPSLYHIGHLVHLPAGFFQLPVPKASHREQRSELSLLLPCHLFATMAERMNSPSPFYDWSVAFFLFPEGTFLEG